MTESIRLIGKNHLVSIISQPTGNIINKSLPAIIFFSGGLLHRIGPNRIFVNIARSMAQCGYLSVRSDFSGIGDSAFSEETDLFNTVVENEAIEIFDYLEQYYQISEFILIGFCSGSDIAYDLIKKDKRAIGFAGINGYYTASENEDECDAFFTSLTQKRYYKYKMFSLKNWGRLISGKSNILNIKNLIIKKAVSVFHVNNKSNTQEHNIYGSPRCIKQSGTEYLLIYSEGSTSFDAYNFIFKEYLTELNPGNVSVTVIKDADHVFTLQWYQNKLISIIKNWILNTNRKWNAVEPAANQEKASTY